MRCSLFLRLNSVQIKVLILGKLGKFTKFLDIISNMGSFGDFDRPPMGQSPDIGSGGEDASELQEFLAMEQQRAQLRAQIQTLTDVCWDKCMDKPSSKLDGKTEGCIENCVARFVDVSLLIANRFSQAIQRKGGGM